MKTNILKSVIAVASIGVLLFSCVNDDDYGVPTSTCVETTLVANKTIQDIPATSNVAQYTQDDVIEGYVVSSDQGGNFFKTVSLQTLDGSAGFSIPMDIENTYTSFQPGRKVLIRMRGLYTDLSSGGKRIGGIFVNSSGDAFVGRMTRAQVQNAVIAACTLVPEANLVRTLTIPQLLNDANINTLVELDGVQFTDAALGKTYYDSANDIGGATNWELEDVNGNKVVFRTSSFAAFAGKLVSPKRGKVRGVLTKFCSGSSCTYQFLARTEGDIKLTEERLIPAFSENFESISNTGNNQFISLPGWTNVSMNNGSERWEARIFSNNKYAQFSPFGLTPPENNVDTRLITPAINVGSTAGGTKFLTFNSKIGFANGEAVTAWISSNYVPAPEGSTPAQQVAAVNAATWVQLNAIFAPQTTSFPANFTSSGAVDLSSYTGNVHISFRYVGGTNGITSTYQIDDIKVIAQ